MTAMEYLILKLTAATMLSVISAAGAAAVTTGLIVFLLMKLS